MNVKRRIVLGLLRLYPSAWRAEYGDELESVLSCSPITLPVFTDVVISATRERLRRALGWELFGYPLFASTLLGIYFNNISPQFRDGSGWTLLWPIFLVCTGCFSVLRRQGAGPTREAVKVALVGFVPEAAAWILWAAGVFHPLVTKAAGPYDLLEIRLALFGSTFPTVPQPHLIQLSLETAMVVMLACVLGFTGGLIGRLILLCLRPRLR